MNFDYGQFHGQSIEDMTLILIVTYAVWLDEANATNQSFIASELAELEVF